MKPVTFAHITDVHISDRDESWGLMTSAALPLWQKCIAQLNAAPFLDFVLVTGDALDIGSETELKGFVDALKWLEKPLYFVPGNHDGIEILAQSCVDPAVVLPQIDSIYTPQTAQIQQAYWSRAVADGLQLIGLDSRVPSSGSGVVDDRQLIWLQEELIRHKSSLIILAIHHPLHATGEHCKTDFFKDIVCRNGGEIDTLLQTHPNVKLVLSGHQHANLIRPCKSYCHVSTSGLTSYPCTYRIVHLKETGLSITTSTCASPSQQEHAYEIASRSVPSQHYAPGKPQEWPLFCFGTNADNTFEVAF